MLYPRNALGRFVPRVRLRTRLHGAADTNRARAFHTTHATTLEFRDDDAERLAALKRDKALRKERPAPSWLDRLVVRQLLEASLLAGGATTSLQTKIKATHSEGSAPVNGSLVSAVAYRARYVGARTDLARVWIVEELQEAITAARFGPRDPKLVPKTREWRKAIAQDARKSHEVAHVYGVTTRTVFNYKREFRQEIAQDERAASFA